MYGCSKRASGNGFHALTNFRNDQLNFEPRFNKLASLLRVELRHSELFLATLFGSFASSVSIRGIHLIASSAYSSILDLLLLIIYVVYYYITDYMILLHKLLGAPYDTPLEVAHSFVGWAPKFGDPYRWGFGCSRVYC